MEYKAFGDERAEKIMLLHGGGLSWWNYRDEAALLGRELPGSTVTILPGLYHGEFSLNHPREYARAVRDILRA